MEIDIDDATSNPYPSKVEIEEVHTVEEALVDVRECRAGHGCELRDAPQTGVVTGSSNNGKISDETLVSQEMRNDCDDWGACSDLMDVQSLTPIMYNVFRSIFVSPVSKSAKPRQ